MRASPETLEWLHSYYDAVDGRRYEEIAGYLHEDCENQIPSGLVVEGRERVMRGMRTGLEALAGTQHVIRHAWEEEDELIFELDVTYELSDGSTITRPGVGIFVMEKGLIRQQRLFVDPTGVWG